MALLGWAGPTGTRPAMLKCHLTTGENQAVACGHVISSRLVNTCSSNEL